MRTYRQGRVRKDTIHDPAAWIYEVDDQGNGDWRKEVRLIEKDKGDVRVEVYGRASDGVLIPKGAGLILAGVGVSLPQRRYEAEKRFDIDLVRYFAKIEECANLEDGALLAQEYELNYALYERTKTASGH